MSKIDNIPPERRSSFPKGKSGNPGGRPKADKIARELIAAETGDGTEIVRFALGVMRAESYAGSDGRTIDVPNDPKSRCWAASWLADRLFGKAPLTVEVSGPAELAPLPDMRDLPLEELRRIAAGEDAAGEDPADSSVH